ncbi:MAG: 30S ribosomal protein S8 [Parcubacteria group bacterium GW2011_GWA2_47_12]|nr:MAG: 30S ribosomal protein S8 [Parcubacteria group bacterium GW2011_GWA2_47_12]
MDSISNIVTRLKNAAHAKRQSITLPHSKFAEAALKALHRAGYMESVGARGEKPKRTLEATLKYENDSPVFNEVLRISKPSRRLYRSAKEIRRVRAGYGKMFLTTSRGIMTDSEARKAKIGGEPLFQIW